MISWNKLIAIVSSFLIPGIGVLLSVVIIGTKALDKIDALTTKVEVISERQDKADDKIDHVSSKVDTIERRQAIYQATHK